MNIIMLIVLWCIVSLLAGICIGSFIRCAQFNAESRWSDPDFSIPELDEMPDQSPAPMLDTKPPCVGIYKTQYVRKGVTTTEHKYWGGDFWCDVKDRSLISFIQNRTWEMI